MNTYELNKLNIEGVDDCFVKYAQIKYIQKRFHKDLEISIRNGITSLCKVHISKAGFTPEEFIRITKKVIGECPPFGVINGKIHTSLHYGIWNNKNQVELVKELVEYNSEFCITNCKNWNDGYNKMQKDQIAKATAALEKMNPSQIYKII